MSEGKVRIAEEKDLSGIVNLLKDMPYESGLLLPHVDIVKLSTTIYALFTRFPIFIYEVEGDVVGVFGYYEDTPFWSHEPFLKEAVFYVHKDYRKTNAAKELIGKVVEVAERQKKPLIIELTTGHKLGLKEKLLERKGFSQIGSVLAIGI